MKIVSPPTVTECPNCHSKDVKAFYESTTGDMWLWLVTVFCVCVEHRHYHCNSCKMIWRD